MTKKGTFLECREAKLLVSELSPAIISPVSPLPFTLAPAPESLAFIMELSPVLSPIKSALSPISALSRLSTLSLLAFIFSSIFLHLVSAATLTCPLRFLIEHFFLEGRRPQILLLAIIISTRTQKQYNKQ